MIRKYFPFCFYVLVSVLWLGKSSLAYPSGSFGGGEMIPAVTNASEIDSITPLKIGDKIPDELWEMTFLMVSAGSDEVHHIKLGDYRDKLIILDFWATWCAPCISSLHKLDTLQQEFADDLLVFPTSYEPQDKVRKFFADKGWSLPTAFEETHLKKYFPHRSIPHQVWIKDGEVMAVPETSYANNSVISSLLRGTDVDILQKKSSDMQGIIPTLYKSELTYRTADPVGGAAIGKRNVSIINASIPTLFREAFRKEIPLSGRQNRVLIEVADSLKAKVDLADLRITGNYHEDLEARKMLNENTYCYYLTLPKEMERESVLMIMKEDLNKIFGLAMNIKARIEERQVNCMILTENGKRITEARQSNEGWRVHGKSPKEVARMLSAVNWQLSTPIFTDVVKATHSISLKSNLRDIDAVKKELEPLGYTLKEEVKVLDVLVIYNAD